MAVQENTLYYANLGASEEGTVYVDGDKDVRNAATLNAGVLNADRVPDLPASKITSGAFSTSRIPNLAASKITSGIFSEDRIPDLDAARIATGTFAPDRIPNLGANKITEGVFAVARIPAGLPYLALGGGSLTGDLSTTGVFNTTGDINISGGVLRSNGQVIANATGGIPAARLIDTIALARIPTGTTSSTVALGNHGHSELVTAVSVSTAGVLTLTRSGTNLTANLATGWANDAYAAASHTHAGGDITGAVTTAEGMIVLDTRGSDTNPSGFSRRTEWHFTEASNVNNPAGTQAWVSLLYGAPWSSYNTAHRQWTLAIRDDEMSLRRATGSSTWGVWRTVAMQDWVEAQLAGMGGAHTHDGLVTANPTISSAGLLTLVLEGTNRSVNLATGWANAAYAPATHTHEGVVTANPTISTAGLLTLVVEGTNRTVNLATGWANAAYASEVHTHAVLTPGDGLSGTSYNGSTARTWQVVGGDGITATATGVQVDTTVMRHYGTWASDLRRPLTFTTTGHRIFFNLASFRSTSSALAGTCIIETGISFLNTMFDVEVDMYEMTGARGIHSYRFKGYAQTTPSVTNSGYKYSGPAAHQIYFARDASNQLVIIIDRGGTWSHPQVHVRMATTMHTSANDATGQGWVIRFADYTTQGFTHTWAINTEYNTSHYSTLWGHPSIIAGDGLSGGGVIDVNRTINVTFGTAAGTVAAGNDARFVTAVSGTGNSTLTITRVGTNLTTDLAHTHANLVAGNGLSGTTYNGGVAQTWQVVGGTGITSTATGVEIDATVARAGVRTDNWIWVRRSATTPAFYVTNQSTGPIAEFRSGATDGTVRTTIANNGNITAPAFFESSSRDLKMNIERFGRRALDIVMGTEVKEFEFKDTPGVKRVGIIAEEVDEIISGGDHKGYNVGDTLALLIKAVQELKEENEVLKGLVA